MRKTDQTDHVEQTSIQDTDDFARRRKIMLGMASAPVVLTLSNAAQANASSHQCVTEFDPGTEPPCTPVTTAAEGNTAIANMNALGWAADPVNSDGDTNTGPTVNGFVGTDKVCVVYAEETSPGIAQIAYNDGGTFIDQNGNTVSGFNGNPVTISCLASFN